MSSTAIAAEVESLQQRKNVLAKQLDDLVERFQNELSALAASWIRQEVESRIENHTDIVATFGVEKLRSLKDKMNSLITSLPDIVS